MRGAGMQAGPASVVAVQAFELWLDPPSRGLVIGISHEGGTTATNRALAAASAAGAQTALITASAGSPGAQLVETVVATEELDHSWCHTVGYLSPILATAAIGAHLSAWALPIGDLEALVADGASHATAAEEIAARLADARTLLVVGSGADRPAARELALKVEEASWLPAATRDLETFLHGHLPATDETTGLVLILTDRASRDERLARALQALAATKVLGVRAAAILTQGVAAEIPADLTPAGRIVIEESPSLPAAVAATIGSATALQLLTERLARARGTNPDPIRRDDARYREAASAAE
jgi:glucosamine--fructose-6-phosphate aminotransferase (isomerizing)